MAVARACRRRPQVGEAQGGEAHAHRDHGLVADLLHQAPRHRCGDRHHQGDGGESQPGLQPCVAEDELQLLGDEEEGAEEGEEHEHDADARRREPGVAEELDLEHRVVGVQLPGDEGADDHEGGGEGAQDAAVRPPVARDLDDAVDQGDEAEDRQCGPDRVHPGRRGVLAVRDDEAPGDQADEDHRHVDQEHRAPPEVTEQGAAHHRADGDAEARDAGPDADGTAPLLGRKDSREDRQRGRHDERPADAHQGPGGGEDVGGAGEGGGHGAQPEDREAHGEGGAAAEAVGQAPGGEQQARKDEDVGIDDPLQLAVGGVERSGERGQGDVQDRVVDADDKEAEAQHGEDPPPPVVANGALHGDQVTKHGSHLLLRVTFIRE